MASYIVQNLSGVQLAVPPPVGKIIPAGGTALVEAASLDTDAIAELINRGKVAIVPQAGGSAGEDSIEAAVKGNAGLVQVMLGAAGVGVDIPNTQTMTFTHNLGSVPLAVLAFDEVAGEPVLPDAGIAVGGDADTVTLANTTGGPIAVNVLILFPPATPMLGAIIAASDARIAVA